MICSICGRSYEYDSRNKKGHTKIKCNSCLVNERRFLQRKKLVELKKAGCSICGYKKNTAAIHFHHVDESAKEFEISGNHCRSKEAMDKEINKCILICANCHAEMHNKDQTL